MTLGPFCTLPFHDQFNLFYLVRYLLLAQLLLPDWKASGLMQEPLLHTNPMVKNGSAGASPTEFPLPPIFDVLRKIPVPRDNWAYNIFKWNPKVLTSVFLAKPAVVWNFSSKGNPAKSTEWKEEYKSEQKASFQKFPTGQIIQGEKIGWYQNIWNCFSFNVIFTYMTILYLIKSVKV